MGQYDSKLLGSEEVARSTVAFHFEKPDGFTFTPGERPAECPLSAISGPPIKTMSAFLQSLRWR
jgi:hypothetical protein